MSDEESFSDRKGPKKSSGRGRGQGRPMPTATISRPGQAKEGQLSVTASTSQDSNKRKVEPQDDTSQTPRRLQEGCSQRETERVCGGVEAYNERFLCIISKGYRLRFTSPPLLRETPWEIQSPQGRKEILGMREQISLMLQKNAITEVPPTSPEFYSNVFLVRKASGGWHSVIYLKSLNAHIWAPHFCMYSTSSVLSTSDLPSKTRFTSFGYFPSV